MQKFRMSSVSVTVDYRAARGWTYRTGSGGENPLVHCLAVANIKSQKKRNLQNERRRVRNKTVRSALKTTAKKVRATASEGEVDAAQSEAREASRALDKAASKGVIHKRTAARRKSRLARELARSASRS
jgi:small subunit ribosomal protein S20